MLIKSKPSTAKCNDEIYTSYLLDTKYRKGINSMHTYHELLVENPIFSNATKGMPWLSYDTSRLPELEGRETIKDGFGGFVCRDILPPLNRARSRF